MVTFKESEIAAIENNNDMLESFDEEKKEVRVNFYPGYPIERKVLDFLGFDLAVYTDHWLEAEAHIDPERRIVRELFFFIPMAEGLDIPTELSIGITNYPEGKLLFDRLMETSNGSLEKFIKQYDDTTPKFKHHTLDPIMYKTNVLGEFGTGNTYTRR